ncbi:MAG: hypothetical protein WD898_00970, partial [Candidatus Paceibacterota bacterium]
ASGFSRKKVRISFREWSQDGIEATEIASFPFIEPLFLGSNGLTGVFQLTNEKKKRFVEVGIQEEQAWITYGPQFKIGKSVSGLIAGTVGHFQGAPWAGPYFSLSAPVSKNVTFSTFHWPGAFPWEPRDWKNDGVDNPERLLKGYIGGAQVDVGPVGISYSVQEFLDDPWNELPGISYTANLRGNFSIKGSATWNNNADRWMLYVGLTWKPYR